MADASGAARILGLLAYSRRRPLGPRNRHSNNCPPRIVILFTMKIPLTLVTCLVAVSTGFAAGRADQTGAPAGSSAPANSGAVRVRFVPDLHRKIGEASGNGASWSKLGAGPEKGVLWLQAHAGIGDKFPVREKDDVTLFDVVVKEGDDDHLVLEIRSKKALQKIDLHRDKRGVVEVDGVKYEILYPSVSVAGGGKDSPTANQAMLMVTRRL